MQRAFRQICTQEGFDELLDKTNQRIADIESLGRTRELVMKDLVLGSKYKVEMSADPTGKKQAIMEIVGKEESDEAEEK